MRLPSKITTYTNSTLARFPIILRELQRCPLEPMALFKRVQYQIHDVAEFIDVLNCLDALRKSVLQEGKLTYVD